MEKLKTILNLIKQDAVIADIGCDAADLIKLGFKQNKIKKAYAIDNKTNPLNRAKENLKGYKNVEFVLSDGLSKVNANDITCAVISGIGGLNCLGILKRSLNKFYKIDEIIVCPHNNITEVRSYFTKLGFMITNETIIEEDNIFYEIIVFKKGDFSLSLKEIIFGPVLLQKRSDVFLKKWRQELNRIKEIPYDNPRLENYLNLITEVLNVEG